MSGGAYAYSQHYIKDIADYVQSIIDRNGVRKTPEELKYFGWREPDWYEKYPEDLYHTKYSDKVIEEFKTAVKKLNEAYVYAQRIDWLLSGDDDENDFLKRLKIELDKL